MPLEWFAFLGSIVEEVIAPIPSFVIMAVAGMAASAQQYPLSGIFLLALLGAIGKTLGAWILYILGDKAEDFVLGHWGKKLGLSHAAMEHVGDRLGKGWKDDLLLFLLRAIPAVPSAPISVLCGVIKLRLRTFILMTLIGCFVRDLAFVCVGYFGTETLMANLRNLERIETILTVITALLLAGFIGWCYIRRSRGLPLPFLGKITNGAGENPQKP